MEMKPWVIFKLLLKKAASLRAINYRLVVQLVRKSVFSGGRGGGVWSGCLGVKPPSLNICCRRFILAFLSSISFPKKTLKMENGKSIQLSGSQLSKAWRWITYRSYKLKRWNISGGRVSSLLKSRVLCKKILTLGEQPIR